MELTPEVYFRLVPKNITPSKFNKIAWDDVSENDKKTYSRCLDVNHSIKFSRFEYKAVRKSSRIEEHYIPGYEGRRVDIDIIFESKFGEIKVGINPANILLFSSVYSSIFDAVSEYPKGYCPSSVSPSAFIRTYIINLLKQNPNLNSESINTKLLSQVEVTRACNEIRRFGDSNLDITRRFESKLRSLDPLNEEPDRLIKDFKTISESLLPFINNKYDMHTLIAMIKIAYSHKSEIKNLTPDKIAQITMLRHASDIHESD